MTQVFVKQIPKSMRTVMSAGLIDFKYRVSGYHMAVLQALFYQSKVSFINLPHNFQKILCHIRRQFIRFFI